MRDRLGGQADLSAAGAFFPPTLFTVRSRMKHRRYMQQKPLALCNANASTKPATCSATGLCRRGSLAGTLVTADPQIARQFIATRHVRMGEFRSSMKNRQKNHRAWLPTATTGTWWAWSRRRGEELGGLRAVKHYMQRTAVQVVRRCLPLSVNSGCAVRKSRRSYSSVPQIF